VQGLERLLGDGRQTASLALAPDGLRRVGTPRSPANSGDMRYADADWEHGLSCVDCRRVLREGDRYSERLTAFAEAAPMVELVCVDCATASAPRPAAPRA
jgi:hypothetical protein